MKGGPAACLIPLVILSRPAALPDLELATALAASSVHSVRVKGRAPAGLGLVLCGEIPWYVVVRLGVRKGALARQQPGEAPGTLGPGSAKHRAQVGSRLARCRVGRELDAAWHVGDMQQLLSGAVEEYRPSREWRLGVKIRWQRPQSMPRDFLGG